MANPSTAHEPSMEEILASIRQIISEDGDAASAERKDAKPVDPAEAKAAPDADLEEARMAKPSKPENAPEQGASMKPQTADTQTKPAAQPSASSSAPGVPTPMQRTEPFRHAEPAPAANAGRSSFPASLNSAPKDEGKLLSERSNAEVSSSFSVLAHTILAQNARTLEDLVAEMLRPMLKEWLDDNLPSLVERLVREEIERVSRGRR
jgi:cell pole-organizing protein PopZ